jgi:16S rRNA processing protein RimM
MKVFPETDDPQRLQELAQVYVGESPETARPVKIESVRVQPVRGGVQLLVRFEGVADREQSDALRGLSVFADAEDLPPVEGDEYFLHDLIGLAVYEDGAEEPVGKVADVLSGVAQDLLVVHRPGGTQVLIPDVPEIVADIDVEAGRIVITPPEGLLD